MNEMYVVVAIDKQEDETTVWETGFKTYEEARNEAIQALKNSYGCSALESFDDEVEDGEYIVEDELAFYSYGDMVFQYMIEKVVYKD